MKKIGVFAATFVMAILLGMSVTIMSPGSANALWGYEYNSGIVHPWGFKEDIHFEMSRTATNPSPSASE